MGGALLGAGAGAGVGAVAGAGVGAGAGAAVVLIVGAKVARQVPPPGGRGGRPDV